MTDPTRDAAIEAAAVARAEHVYAQSRDHLGQKFMEIQREHVTPLVDAVLAVARPAYRAEALRDGKTTLALHQLNTILPYGVACTCGAELSSLNAPLDDARINGEALALATHQVAVLRAEGRA